MVDPSHIFAEKDEIWLRADYDANLKAIQAFYPNDGKLVLHLQESFNDEMLLAVGGALSHNLNKWELANVWYILPYALKLLDWILPKVSSIVCIKK